MVVWRYKNGEERHGQSYRARNLKDRFSALFFAWYAGERPRAGRVEKGRETERWILTMTKLFKAIRQNDIETVKKVLQKYPEKVNCMATPPPKKDEGQSPLQVAIKVGNIEIAHYLIDQGADVNHMEPYNGLPPTGCYRCPLLFDAIMALLADWKNRKEEKLGLISRLLEAGADPNKTDNRGSTSWDFAINHYCDIITRVDDVTDIQKVEKELLDILFKYDADILNIDRINEDLKVFTNYSLVLNSLILNRDDLYGVSPERERQWKKRWLRIIPILKPYYMKNNPNYPFLL